MPHDLQVHFDKARGQLTLTCGNEAFSRMKSVVLAELESAERSTVASADFHLIVIGASQSNGRPSRSRDRMALVGCALIVIAVLSVLIVGMGTILKWLQVP